MSIYDKASKNLAPALRKYQDLTLLFGGTKTQVLRISKSSMDALPGKYFDAFGYSTDTPTGEVIDDAGIIYPSGLLETFMDIETGHARISSYDFIELLPIKLILRFTGLQAASYVDLGRGDIIVDVLRDENGNKIPMVMEVTRTYGQFFIKDIVAKKADLVLRWDDLDQSVQNSIDTYIATVT